jgi:hypothetical protein
VRALWKASFLVVTSSRVGVVYDKAYQLLGKVHQLLDKPDQLYGKME